MLAASSDSERAHFTSPHNEYIREEALKPERLLDTALRPNVCTTKRFSGTQLGGHVRRRVRRGRWRKRSAVAVPVGGASCWKTGSTRYGLRFAVRSIRESVWPAGHKGDNGSSELAVDIRGVEPSECAYALGQNAGIMETATPVYGGAMGGPTLSRF